MNTLSPRAAKELATIVERECAAFEDVIAILRREQELLVAGAADVLEATVNAKNAGLNHIERLRQERLIAMERAGAPKDPARLEAFIAPQRELAAKWSKLRLLAREGQRLNTLNGRLVSVRLQFVSGRLDTLRRAAGSERLYDAAGRADGAPSGRVIASV
jgi:flagellar biosynthesis/type III secretory pathway chaperone